MQIKWAIFLSYIPIFYSKAKYPAWAIFFFTLFMKSFLLCL